ncbi:YciI family protein [Pokkaliibacter sp. CJK22405]|uniref:YciI family protein n=1 Tax=Pokkaliibacter sp. CJK22405 TaxID=3384615 RepID=UPI003984F627
MKHFLLVYDYVFDYPEKRERYRAEHLAYCNLAVNDGLLVLGGATMEGNPQGVLVFKAHDRRAVEEFVSGDVYVTSGIVKAWHIKEWITVVGDEALNPVRLAS